LVVNAQKQERYVWPDEPVVAKAYIDQLLRSQQIEQAQANTLTDLLNRSEELLASGEDSSNVAGQLEAMAERLSQSSEGSRGVTRQRFVELSSTMNGIAERL